MDTNRGRRAGSPPRWQDGQWCACFKVYLAGGLREDLIGSRDTSADPHKLKSAARMANLAISFFNFWACMAGEEKGMSVSLHGGLRALSTSPPFPFIGCVRLGVVPRVSLS